jgi:adenine phosphoribosyltransferase
VSEDYSLEYGKATIEVHMDSVDKEDRIAVVDDLIATGGTLLAASKLFQRLGAAVVEVTAVIDLPELGGSQLLNTSGLKVMSLIEFSESE